MLHLGGGDAVVRGPRHVYPVGFLFFRKGVSPETDDGQQDDSTDSYHRRMVSLRISGDHW